MDILYIGALITIALPILGYSAQDIKKMLISLIAAGIFSICWGFYLSSLLESLTFWDNAVHSIVSLWDDSISKQKANIRMMSKIHWFIGVLILLVAGGLFFKSKDSVY